MWIVIYGRHWVYLTYKELRYETQFWIIAFLVYLWWQCRYSMTMYPVKYLKMYKSEDVIQLKKYAYARVGKRPR